MKIGGQVSYGQHESAIRSMLQIICDELRLSSASAHNHKQFDIIPAERTSHSAYSFCSRAQLHC